MTRPATSFGFEGTDARGTATRGIIEADGLAGAATELRVKGIEPLSIDRREREEPEQAYAGADGFVFFNRCLARMTRVGIPLPHAIRQISNGLRRGRLKKDLERVEKALREGMPLDEAVAEAPKRFPTAYRWMLRAGAASGNLPSMLLALARHCEMVRRAKRASFNALAYPATILILGATLVAAMLMLVFPTFELIYTQYRFEAPAIMRLLRSAAQSPWTMGGSMATGIVFFLALCLWTRRTLWGERFLFRTPVIGRIFRLEARARFFGSLAVMLRARIPLPEALPVAVGASGCIQLLRVAERLREGVAEGSTLSAVLRDQAPLGKETGAYLMLAERTGRLPGAVEELSELYGEQATETSTSLFYVLFPGALLVVGTAAAVLLGSVVQSYVTFVEQIRP